MNAGTKRCQTQAQKGVRNRLLIVERRLGIFWHGTTKTINFRGLDLSCAEPGERADADLYEGRRLHRVRDGA
jgi:hypothetical protein